MSAIIKTQFRLHNAAQFVEGLGEAAPSNIYAFQALPMPWASETLPPVPVESVQDELSLRQGIMTMKKLTSADVYRAINHNVWTAGRYYNAYRCDYGESGVTAKDMLTGTAYNPTSLFDTKFYVVSNDRVFMCLQEGSSASSVDPDSVENYTGAAFRLSDGYVWKFVTAPSQTLLTKKTIDFFPIDNTASAAITYSTSKMGGVYVVRNNTGSSGWGVSTTYTAAVQYGQLGVRGDGSGFECDIISNSSGGIQSITVTNPGSGYTWMELYQKTGGTTTGLVPMLTPVNGLGTNPINDLLATTVICAASFEYRGGDNENGKWPALNPFRSIGLIRDVCTYGSNSNVYTSADENVQTTYVFKVTNATGLTAGNLLTNTASGNYVVLDVWYGVQADPDVSYDLIYAVKLQERNTGSYANDVAAAEPTTGNYTLYGTSTVFNVIGVDNPDVNTFSGEVLYIEHRRPTNRGQDQKEDVIFAIEF